MTGGGVAAMLGFDLPERREWEDLASRVLRGATLDDLVIETDDGVAILPLYTEAQFPTADDPAGRPGAAPFTRGPSPGPRGWELRQRHDLEDAAATAAAIRADLAGGVSSIWLRLRRPPAPGELLAALAGVDPAASTVVVDGGPWFAAAAEATAALAAAVPPGSVTAAADPLGALARHGFLPCQPTEALAALAPLVDAARSHHPARSRRPTASRRPRDVMDSPATAAADAAADTRRTESGRTTAGEGFGGAAPRDGTDGTTTAGAGRPTGRVETGRGGAVVAVDATVYADAGAPAALELACVLATGAAYLRALEAGGLAPEAAAPHIEARLVATADKFATIVKLRAARTAWDHLLAACGVPADRRRALRCWAVTSEAMLVAQDPLVNLVRATLAGFAAAAGGAECLTVLPYDTALGPPGERGRRLARNISHLLADESHLGAVADPAGGSWYAEERTRRLAEAAWTQFQELEANGGMPAALVGGSLAARINAAAQQRQARLASGTEHIVGVTCFQPNPDPDPGNAATPSPPSPTTSLASDQVPSTAHVSDSDPAAPVPPPDDAVVRVPPFPIRRPATGDSS